MGGSALSAMPYLLLLPLLLRHADEYMARTTVNAHTLSMQVPQHARKSSKMPTLRATGSFMLHTSQPVLQQRLTAGHAAPKIVGLRAQATYQDFPFPSPRPGLPCDNNWLDGAAANDQLSTMGADRPTNAAAAAASFPACASSAAD